MISIYDKFATKNQVLFNDGLAVLDDICLNYEITEKANGEYGVTFRFGIDQINNKHEFIVDEAIIKCPDVYGDEVFRINKITKNSNREIQVYARHITYDILNLFLEDVRPTELNGQAFLDWIFTRTTTLHEFTYSSDITSTATSYFINKNMYEALFSADNSFLNRLGGEVRRNQYNISINASSGQDRGVTIQSRKNLTGFEAYTDIDSVITRIYPKGSNDLTIPEKYIDSEYIENYPNIKSQEVVFNGIGVDEENGVTEAEAQQQLRDAVGKMYSEQQVDLLRGEYKINFVTLEKTEEYKNFGLLERIWLYDTVSVYEENYDIDINVKVIERKYNGKRQIHNSISLSNVAEKSVSTINKIISMLNSISDPQTGFLQQAKDNATQLITNGLSNSYVLVRKNEILIMDTQDINTAVKVWRWNVNGLGYSSTGYNGTFGLAMTMDGSIVADFINVGILNAGLIKAGLFESFNGLTWINMTNGNFNFADKLKFDGTTMSLTGDFTTYDADTGNKAIEIEKRILRFYDWNSNNECARMFSGKIIGQEEKKGTTLVARNGRYLTLSYEDGSGLFQPAMLLDAGAFGTNGKIDLYDASIQSGEEIWIQNLYVSGTKNCIQDTENYGKRLLYAYETTENYLGDLVHGKIDENGECVISIEEIFGECVNTDIQYHVFTQTYKGSISEIELYPNYFIVKGEVGTFFSCEIKAKRIGFEHVRLEQKFVGKNANIEDELNFKELSTDIEEELNIDLSKELLEVE